MPDQEQAKTYYTQIDYDNKDYTVEVSNPKMINEFFQMANIDMDFSSLDKNGHGILMSVRTNNAEHPNLTYYFSQKNGRQAEHRSIANNAPKESNYALAAKVIERINTYMKGYKK